MLKGGNAIRSCNNSTAEPVDSQGEQQKHSSGLTRVLLVWENLDVHAREFELGGDDVVGALKGFPLGLEKIQDGLAPVLVKTSPCAMCNKKARDHERQR